ncbi:hypothetical protein A7D27_02580 [Pseudomonas sp. 1D4]|uniref:DUF3509 domain-containing protein n=1 Tax=unclassified Pseudomonas TaxID=196821 RepID=UPI00084A60D8|nr:MULTISPECIES: DUF3509 domain-containing protein [unclassified Pseudomonas]OEC46809.1 hypothetical protein A7D27_02580 [Pseudomonas sp. 1D4]OEC61821.1 hypothetical protein A9G05_02140 [Pseudomonas sp. ENNP23]
MYNPFQILTDAFQADYRVNLSLERLDGNIMLTLADDKGVVARRMISPAQRNDPKRLARVIESIRFGIAIEKGGNVSEMLTAMTSGKPLPAQAHSPVGGTGSSSLGAGY